MINIKGLDKAGVLAALYNSSHVQGMGVFQARPGNMTIEQARAELKGNLYFDYLYGKIMKVDLSKDEFEERLYDRDNWNGAAYEALKKAGILI